MDFLLQLTACVILLLASTLNAQVSDKPENMTLRLVPSDNETAEVELAAAPAILPNVNYIGLGYDPILGNPQSNLYDPGFRQAAILLEYNRGGLTSDGKWLVPDGVQVLSTVSCSYASQSEEVMGSSSYQQSLAVDVSLSGSFAGGLVKFTGSSEYKQVYESTSTYKRILTSSVARCVLYKAVVNYNYEAYNVTAAFASAVNSLPTTRDDAAYVNFINAYGTHFTSTMYTGAKAIITSEFESTGWTRLDSEGFNFRAGADASFLVFSASASVATEEQRRLQQTFDSARTSYKASYIGSRPPPDGKWETWASTSGENPYPIQYTLTPLTELFTAKYFPAVDPAVLAARRDLLNATVTVYCDGTPGCGIPPPDRVPVRMNRVNASFMGTLRQTCRPGLSLLSCGVGKRATGSTSDPADFSRYAIPVDNSSCDCKDNSGGVCSQWCSNSAKGFTIAVAGPTAGVFNVLCPTGTKVLGCHIQPNTAQEVWQWNFPLTDGTGCTCYDYFGAKCYATCASNVVNHEVRTAYGKGLLAVKCSPNNFVLGCGVKPVAGGAVEKWRYHQVASVDSCECYDNGGGSTCYAVCGQTWVTVTTLSASSAARTFPLFCTDFSFRRVMLWLALAVVPAVDFVEKQLYLITGICLTGRYDAV